MVEVDNKNSKDSGAKNAPASESKNETAQSSNPQTQKPKFVFPQYKFGSDAKGILDIEPYFLPEVDAREEMARTDYRWIRQDNMAMIRARYLVPVRQADCGQLFREDAFDESGNITTGKLNNGKPEMNLCHRPMEAKIAEDNAIKKCAEERINPEVALLDEIKKDVGTDPRSRMIDSTVMGRYSAVQGSRG